MLTRPNPDDSAKAAVAFEARTAAVSWNQADQRDVEKTYNPTSIAELRAYAPEFDWDSYLRDAGAPGLSRVVLAEESAVHDIVRIVAETPLDTLKAWETFRTVDQASPRRPSFPAGSLKHGLRFATTICWGRV